MYRYCHKTTLKTLYQIDKLPVKMSPFASPFTCSAFSCMNKEDIVDSVHVPESPEKRLETVLGIIRQREMSKYLHRKLKVPPHPSGRLDKQVSESITHDIKRDRGIPCAYADIGHSPEVGIIGSQRRVRFAPCVKCT